MASVTGSVLDRWRDTVRGNRVWRSIFRHGYAGTPLDQSLAVFSNFFLHVHAVKVHRHSLRPTYTFGLGLIAFAALPAMLAAAEPLPLALPLLCMHGVAMSLPVVLLPCRRPPADSVPTQASRTPGTSPPNWFPSFAVTLNRVCWRITRPNAVRWPR